MPQVKDDPVRSGEKRDRRNVMLKLANAVQRDVPQGSGCFARVKSRHHVYEEQVDWQYEYGPREHDEAVSQSGGSEEK